jgi:hypothetical protein
MSLLICKLSRGIFHCTAARNLVSWHISTLSVAGEEKELLFSSIADRPQRRDLRAYAKASLDPKSLSFCARPSSFDAREEFVRAATQRERINLRKIKRYKVVFDKIPGSANG